MSPGAVRKGNPLAGALYLIRGFGLIRRSGVRRFVLIPLLINTLLFALLIGYGARRLNQLIDWLLPQWLDWLAWLLWPLFAVGAAVVLFYGFVLAANLVGAPFNGLLAEAVERHLRGEVPRPPEGWWRVIRDLGPALISELKKLWYFIIRAVPLLLLFLIPGLNLAAPFLWFAFTAWMLALEYADYPMGNHGLLFAAQRERLLEKRPLVFGFGAAALVLTLIPFLNFLAMPTAVAGATALWVEQFARGPSSQPGPR